MRIGLKILPGTGRGTARSAVEGLNGPLRLPTNPSTTALRAAVPLPVPGRIK